MRRVSRMKSQGGMRGYCKRSLRPPLGTSAQMRWLTKPLRPCRHGTAPRGPFRRELGISPSRGERLLALRHELEEHLRVVDEWGLGRHPQPERREDLDVKNAAGVVRGAVGVPAQRVRHADLVGIEQALRDEDD